MVGKAALLPFALWASSAQAFYPWLPHSVCAGDSALCTSQTKLTTTVERSLPANVATAHGSPEGLRFKIGRKAPAGARTARTARNESPKARVERMAQRLEQKYGEHRYRGRRPTPASSPSSPNSPSSPSEPLDRRANTFSVVTAATPSATNAAGIYQDGTDFSYFVEAHFGSGSTPLLMLLDTGAGTTWVMGADCDSSACATHSSYGTSDSTSLDASSSTFAISYGSGSVAGNLATDTISLASLSLTMTFGLADTTSDDFNYFPFDGILGMGRSKGSTDNFLASVGDAELLPANVFGVSLWRASDGGDNTGEVMFGAADASKYTGDLSFTATTNRNDWAIPMDDFGYDGDKAGVTGRRAYIDTGTTYVFGPAADVATLHAQIPGAASDDGVTYTVPCTSNRPLTVFFSGVAYSIAAADWLSGADSDGTCTSNIYGRAVVANAWLLGDLFIKNVYAVFDADQSRIGFATKPTASSTTSTAATSTSSAASTFSVASGSTTVVTTAAPSSSSSSSAAAASASASSDSSIPGLSGQETQASSAAPASSTSVSAPAATTAVTSPAERLEGSVVVKVVCFVAAIAMVA